MARRSDPLAAYNAKRDFAKTAEPRGRRGKNSGNRFLVQKHDATRLHYDFRLEVGGVLKSWAVTRGPSLDPDDKRLAVRTEDHPLDYADFEGTIPAGEYGGGTVMLWDTGTWAPVAGKSAADLEEGHLHFTLNGERMKGEWLLVRMKGRPGEKRENWLLRKIGDAYACAGGGLVDTCLTSVKSGRTMREIAEGAADPPPLRGKGKPPAFQKPQLATLVDHVPDGRHWLHEMKYDGYRSLVAVGGAQARIYTRSGLDWSDKFPDIAREAAALPAASALIDGEIVYMDKHGSPSFSGLQAALKQGGGGLVLFAFDLLALDGEDLKRLPNIERKERLRDLLGAGGKTIQFAEHIVGAGEKLFEAMCAAGQEGIISKRADARYAGRRTRNWLKIKCTRRQEFVIVGWSESTKRRGFASLLLAVHDKGRLRYAGRVGTGFSGETITALSDELAAIARKAPSVEVPRAMRRGARWVEPELVAEIAFAEFTADGQVRHASFLGLRPDKPAEEVGVEEPQPIDPPGSSVVISNPDRVIFPSSRITKGDLAGYYDKIAPLMLKVTANRPISLVRCPQGRARNCFFQKHDAGSFGEHVRQVTIKENDGDRADYLYVADRDGILACVQMGTIEFHGWGAPVGDVEHPDRLVFDLDPDESVDFADVKKAARDIQRHLSDMGLASFPMLTGGKGVHVIAPLDRGAAWPEVKDFARRFAHALAEAEPERFTAALAKARRKGRIFIDWLRNQRGATAILPYSARARPGAPVAAPVSWDELDDLDTASAFSVEDAERLIERAETRALARWGEARQSLPAL